MALSAKQQVFVREYLTCWNATEAARRAEYSGNDKTLASVGWENLRKPEIAAEIKARLAERVMSADEVLDRFSEQARAAYSRYLTPDGTVDLHRLIADGKAHLIKKIKPGRYGNEIEFYDAHSARELLGKHHKLWADKLEVDVRNVPFAADELAQSEAEIDEWTHKRQNGQESNG